MKKTIFVSIVLLAMLALASCSGSSATPTPTPVDIGALQTAAVQTVFTNLTQTAAAASPTPEPTQPPATETPQPQPTETQGPTATPTSITCDNAEFIADVSVTDGTQMTAGQDFIKTWKVKNIGTCTWNAGYQIIFAYGERMGGQAVALPADVPPNTEVELSLNLKAPATAGTYSGYWRLSNNNGFAFGQTLTVVIVVP